MLTREENERLTRVGPGTPMGELFRRYWIPAVLSSDLPEADGAPIRVRLLGEDLIAFRDTEGVVGLVGAYCPHRRAPLFFGRNEECGLRCVYHGWKFDRNGRCVDMPSEPPDSLFKTKVRLEAYPTWEGGGIVWTYMGPLDLQPPPPDPELVRAPQTHRYVSKTFEDCNFLQAVEGGIDPTHATILHNMEIGDLSFLRNFKALTAEIDLEETDYGFRYAGIRSWDQEQQWVRCYHYIMPSYHMRGVVEGYWARADWCPTINGHIWVPIDDGRTWVFNFMYSHDPARPVTPEIALQSEERAGRGPEYVDPNGIPYLNRSNDYRIDRDLQKRSSFTGIRGINTQDFAIQEGMGTPPINDRTKEHLGTTDRAIIFLRKLLLSELEKIAQGGSPRGVDPRTYRNVRAVDRRIPKGLPWREAVKDDLVARF
jgi:phthalate 4,5-dioxygenase oxygenase subunit